VPVPKKLFLSHASQDRPFVNKLATFLAERRIPFWYSKRNLVGAQQWHDEIGRALKTFDWFLVVLSSAAVRSKWVKRELLYALQADRYENRIVPVRIEPCDVEALSWTLASIQRVDFLKGFKKSCHELIKIWGTD
jgi:hypothetical protein